jgi:hypothetical protein
MVGAYLGVRLPCDEWGRQHGVKIVCKLSPRCVQGNILLLYDALRSMDITEVAPVISFIN